MITVADYPALTDDLQEVFEEASASAVADLQGLKIFDVKETDRKTYDYQIMHGLAGIKEVTPGEDLPSVNSNQGDSITYTQRYFGAKFSVTKEMRKFDLYDKIMSLPKALVDDAWNKVDQSMADVLLNGFSASNYTDVYGKSVAAVGPDGKALFASNHDFNVGVLTYSNIITDEAGNANPALDRPSIVKARATAAKWKDANGLVRGVNLDTLIVSPENEDLAIRIINSDQISGKMDNDINPLKGKIKNLIVWPRLSSSSAGTDTSAYWFLAEGKNMGETLKALFAERPSMDEPGEVYANKNWDYSCDYFYTLGIGHPAYVYGSQGSYSA